jgi:hypothetical protein
MIWSELDFMIGGTGARRVASLAGLAGTSAGAARPAAASGNVAAAAGVF